MYEFLLVWEYRCTTAIAGASNRRASLLRTETASCFTKKCATLPDAMLWEHRTPSPAKTLCELLALATISLLCALNVAFGVYAWFGESPKDLGFEESLQDAFHRYYPAQIAPPWWNYGIWFAIYAWQAAWILHAWSFTVRPNKPRTIYPGLYPTYILACGLNIGWLYSWCNMHPELSMALMGLLVLALGISVALVVRYLYKIHPTLKFFQERDLVLTHILTVNGLMLYVAWAVVNTLLVLGYLLIEDADLHVKTTTTVVLSLLASLTLSYFILENTILDRYLRYTVTVYPVVIWYMAGIVAENWDSIQEDSTERNNVCMVVLTVIAIVLFALRAVLLTLFLLFRPIREYEETFDDIVPH